MSREQKVSRRDYIKYATGAVIGAAVAGVGGYYLGQAAAPGVTGVTGVTTVTEMAGTVTKTVTRAEETIAEGKPIRVGQTLPLTGFLAPDGELCKIGLDLAIRKINEEGGIQGRPVEAVVYDDAYEIQKVTSLYERLITEDKVDILLSPFCTYVGHPAYGVAYKHKKAMFCVCTVELPIEQDGFYYLNSQNELGAPGGGWTDDWIRLFRDWDQWADPKWEYPKTVAMTLMATPYGEALRKGWAPQWEAIGIEPVWVELFDFTITDYSPFVEKLKALKPDIYCQIAYLGGSVLAWRQGKAAGLDKVVRFYMNDGGAEPEFYTKPEKGGLSVAEAELTVAYGCNQWSEKWHGGWADWLRDEYEKVTGSRAGGVWGGAGNFNALELAYRTIKMTNSLDDDVLATYLRHNTVTTCEYNVRLDEWTGLNVNRNLYTTVQYVNGKPITVHPKELVEGVIQPYGGW